MAKIALVTGQDSAYLAGFLLNKGYEVHVRTSLFNTDRSEHFTRIHMKKNASFLFTMGT